MDKTRLNEITYITCYQEKLCSLNSSLITFLFCVMAKVGGDVLEPDLLEIVHHSG